MAADDNLHSLNMILLIALLLDLVPAAPRAEEGAQRGAPSSQRGEPASRSRSAAASRIRNAVRVSPCPGDVVLALVGGVFVLAQDLDDRGRDSHCEPLGELVNLLLGH